MIERVLDESYPSEVRREVVPLTVARLWANAGYRFTAPFLAVIARGLDVSLDELGIAVAVSEIMGLTSPAVGHLVDRIARRAAMLIGLTGVVIGALVAATSTGRPQFAIGLVLLGQSKVLFDLGVNAWIADHVPYARRGRVIGIVETSWALGLLVGVSLLGLLAAATSWRAGFIGAAAAVGTLAVVVASRLRREYDEAASLPAGDTAIHGDARTTGVTEPAADPRSVWRRAWRPVLGMAALMATAQCMFVTFGSWLEDTFGFGAAQLSAVTFLLGGVELFASITAARRTDVWGKERSVSGGAVLMVPAMVVLAAFHDHVVPGIALLAIALIGFEFGIVSSLSLGTQIIPSAPGRGLGMMIGAGTAGRAVVSVVGTRMYTDHGFGAPMLLGAALAAVAALAFWPRASRPDVR